MEALVGGGIAVGWIALSLLVGIVVLVLIAVGLYIYLLWTCGNL